MQNSNNVVPDKINNVVKLRHTDKLSVLNT